MGAYESIIKRKQKEWNCDDLMDSAKRPRGSKIPFSSPLLNFATYGGIPRDKMTEFFGDPGGGKSSTAVDICKNAVEIFKQEWEAECDKLRDKISRGDKQASLALEELQDRGPKKALYIDIEHSFDMEWAKTLGVEDGSIDIMQPPDIVAEELLQMIMDLIETGEVGIVVLDSIPSLVPRAELEKKLGERTVSALAGLLTIFTRKVVPLLARYQTTLLSINQTRDNMHNPYVVQTPGGRAVKFYCSLRILFRIGSPVDFLGNELPANTENPAGHIIHAQIKKQKSAPWDRKAGSYYLMSDSGIRVDMDYAQLAVKKYNIIKKSGAWFTICDPRTGEILDDPTGKPLKLNGMSKVLEYLQTNKEYFDVLREFIQSDIEGRDPNYVSSMLQEASKNQIPEGDESDV